MVEKSGKKTRSPRFTKSSVFAKPGKLFFRNALMLVGLPGIGLVSKMAVDHLARSLGAEKIAALYSPHFPNQALALKNGRLRAFSMKFYHKRVGNRELVLLRGDLQPLTVEGQYEVTAAALSFARKIGVTECIAMAGYAVNRKSENPAVYASSGNKNFLETFLKKGARTTPGVVPIVGMAGLIPALSRLYGIRGACVLVETPGNAIDARGAKTLLELLEKILGTKIDSRELEKRAEKADKMLKKLEHQAMEAQKLGQAPAATEPIRKDALNYIR